MQTSSEGVTLSPQKITPNKEILFVKKLTLAALVIVLGLLYGTVTLADKVIDRFESKVLKSTLLLKSEIGPDTNGNHRDF